jgi:hypothetical protein
MGKSISSINDYPMTLVKAWKANPSLAARDLLYKPLSGDPDDWCDIIPIQRIVLNRIWNSLSSIVLACRGFGKTYLIAVTAVLSAMLNPGRQVGTLSASFRQAKLVFEEIRAIWESSPILQACTERAPVMANDSCRLEFKRVGSHKRSVIKALPLASGDKIRGSRFHLVCADEICQIQEMVYNMVIRPFGSTSQEPTKQVRLYKEMKKIEESSVYSDDEKRQLLMALSSTTLGNQLLGFTSGYYAHNWVYGLYKKYSNRMHNVPNDDDDDLGEGYTDNPADYATFQIPWKALPPKFLSEKSLRDARRDMNSIMFAMEYCAAWISDSGGFFSQSEIDACCAENRGMKFYMSGRGDPSKAYIMTIDPARTSDAFAIIVSELDFEVGLKITHIEQHFKMPTPDVVDRIWELYSKFNIVEIAMDRGGGGQTVADFLARGATKGGTTFSPILDKGDDRYKGVRGNRILTLIDFSTNWIENANHNAKFLLERKNVVFPAKPIDGAKTESGLLELDRQSQIIKQLIMQLISIRVSETRTGKAHFDLPETGGGFVKHKDLYSAFLIACDSYYNIVQSHLTPTLSMPLLGLVIPIESSGQLW